MRFSQLWVRGFAALAMLLIAMPASAHSLGPNFAQAVDLGTTTEWPTSGVTSEPTDIPDVDGYGANYFKFRVAERGTVLVWTSGGFSPDLQVFDGSAVSIGTEDDSRRAVVLDPGLHYVRARSRSVGRYRLHVAGGGRGHDDVGNTRAQSAPLPGCRGLASEDPTECRPSESEESEEEWDGRASLNLPARLDYERDRDWFKFKVPDGPQRRVRIWSSGSTDTLAVLYDGADFRLGTSDDDGSDRNFYLFWNLSPGTTYYVGVYGAYHSTTGSYRLHLAGADDHGDFFETASRTLLGVGTPGRLDYYGDRDRFWFYVAPPGGTVRARATGSTPAHGCVHDAYEIELACGSLYRHFWSGVDFTIDDLTLDSGLYYISVWGSCGGFGDRICNNVTGAYNLHLSGDASGVNTVPLLPADGNARGQQGFVRVTNHSDHEAEVEITAVDDTGMRRTLSSPLALAPWQTRHFNSGDLERGNPNKGIASGGVGDGTGNWYLEVSPSRPEVEVLSYIRTEDGFLTSMHTQAPSYGRTHRVATFNPGRNRNQASRLRLINLKCPSLDPCDPVNVTIYGVDDAGKRSPNVRLTVADGAAREVTAAELEGLDAADGLDGAIGTGSGKWQLFVTADRPIQVMSLLESVSGHLTNLSAPASRQVFSTPERQE